MKARLFACFLWASFLAVAAGIAGELPNPCLFVDDSFVAQSDRVQWVLQQPEKLPEPVLPGNGKWDVNPYLFGTILYDEEDGIYKAWYQSYNSGQPLATRTPFLYATSQDGLKWERPNLGLFEWEGSTENNIVLQNAGFHDAYSPSVVKDPFEKDPERRYKMAFWDFCGHDAYGGDSGMMVAFSADGIHWKRLQERPVLVAAKQENAISDVINIMQDPDTRKFLVFAKGWADPFPSHRQIVRAESDDFVHWSTPEPVLRHANDERDPESYGMGAFKVSGMYFGLLRIYKSKTTKQIDTQLAASYDGKQWFRVADQATFIPNGPDGSWDGGMIFAVAPVIRGDTMQFFYGGWDGAHDEGNRAAAIGLACLPLNRFVAVMGRCAASELSTKPFTLRDDTRFAVNADGRDGEIRVALLDADGAEIPGFGHNDAPPIRSNGFHHPLAWHGKPFPEAAVGKQCRLHFSIQGNAKLFAFDR